MIHYQLRCGADHAFDGWFKSSAAFDLQAGQGLVACPECGDTHVGRALMTPAIGRPSAVAEPPAVAEPVKPSDQPMGKSVALLPDKMRAVLQKIRAEVERSSAYVGPEFADEARRIHRGESEARSIYGESSEAEAESLADEGVLFMRLPWVPRADG